MSVEDNPIQTEYDLAQKTVDLLSKLGVFNRAEQDWLDER